MTSNEANARSDFRRLYTFELYLLAAVWGGFQAVNQNALLYFLAAMLFASVATAWCAADARIHGKPLLPVLQMITFFLWPVAVPIYLVATRRLRGLVYALLHAIGLYGLTTICFLAAAYLLNRS